MQILRKSIRLSVFIKAHVELHNEEERRKEKDIKEEMMIV